MPPADNTDPWKLQRELLGSPEWETVKRIDAFARSVRMLENNAHELWRAVHYLTQDPRTESLGSVNAKDDRDRWLEEVLRRLHNLVAATKMVIDHARKLNRDLYGNRRRGRKGHRHHGSVEYARRVRAMAAIPIVAFVHKLRDFFLHWRMPAIYHVQHLNSRSEELRTIALGRDDLLAWGEWSTAARRFVEDAADNIDIGRVVDLYMEQIRAFYEWFADELGRVHATEYAVVNAALAKLSRLRAPLVFEALREDVRRVEAKQLSPYEALAHLLGSDDRLFIDGLRDHPVSWVESALFKMRNTYGEVPSDVAAALLHAARSQ